MGCGGSKEVATANTVVKRSLFRRKSSVSAGKTSEATTADNQQTTKTENPEKTQEKIESTEKTEVQTEALQNSGDKNESSTKVTEEKTVAVEKAEVKVEAKEKPESEIVEKPKIEDEVTVLKTNSKTPPESDKIDSLVEEGENKVVEQDKPEIVDNSTTTTVDHDQELKDSVVIAEVPQNKEEIVSKEADVVESSGEHISKLKETILTEEVNAGLKETISTEKADAEVKETPSTEETKTELQEIPSTEDANTEVANLEEKTIEETPATKESNN